MMVSAYWTSIVIGLLNYGAVEIQAGALLCIPVFLMIPVACVVFGTAERTIPAVVTVIALMAIALATIAIQTMALPYGLLSNPAWKDIASIAPSIRPSISLTPGDDWSAALRIALPFGVFILALQLFDTDERALGAIKVLAISGGVVAALSILQFKLAPETLLFWPKIAYIDSLTGFFVNRNTAATYFGLVTLLNFALLLQALRESNSGPAGLLVLWGKGKWPTITIYGQCLLTTLVALMLTRSRAGLLASALSIAFVAICSQLRGSQRTRIAHSVSSRLYNSSHWLRRGVSVALALVTLLTVIQVLGGLTLLRAQAQGLEDSRFCVMPGILSAIVRQLPWGSGLGSFEVVFPGYRDPTCGIYGLWNRAHNFYLEGAFTFGLTFFVLTLIAAAMLVRFFCLGMRDRKQLKFAPEIGLSVSLLIAVHSVFDFSLQISGLAVVAAALLAPLVTISLNRTGWRPTSRLS